MIEKLPVSLCGLSLGNIGISVMWRNLGYRKFMWAMENIEILVYCFELHGLFLLLLYLIKVIFSRAEFFKDFSQPGTLASLGAFTMAISLSGSILMIDKLHVHVDFAVTIILFGALLQIVVMCRFFQVCWHGNIYPEPFWNAAVLSSVFPAITLPESYEYVMKVRQAFHGYAWICFAFMMPHLIFRTMYISQPDKVVANNPSVSLLQAGTSIMW